MKTKLTLLKALAFCVVGTSTSMATLISPSDQQAFSDHVGNIEIKLPEQVTLTITDSKGGSTNITTSGQLVLKPGLETNASRLTFNAAAMPLAVRAAHVKGVHPVKGVCNAILPTSDTQAETVKLDISYSKVPVFNSIVGYDCYVTQGKGVGKSSPADMLTKIMDKALPQIEATLSKVATKLTDFAKDKLDKEFKKVK